MEEKKVLKEVADTVISKSVTFEIDIIKRTWLDRLLIKFKWKPAKREFVITPVTLGSLVKISKELIDIDLKVFDSTNLLESNYHLIEKYAEKMARIAAIAVVNNKDDPSKDLVNFFLDNLTTKELFHIASIVLQQMDIGNFLHTIISIKGTNVLQTTPANARDAK